MAAMLVDRKNKIFLLWELPAIFMQTLWANFLSFCPPTWWRCKPLISSFRRYHFPVRTYLFLMSTWNWFFYRLRCNGPFYARRWNFLCDLVVIFVAILALSRPGFFCILWPGEGDSSRLHNSETNKASTMILGGQIVRLEIFLLRSVARGYDVTRRGKDGYLGFWIFPKSQ